jgi:hypothetical protein
VVIDAVVGCHRIRRPTPNAFEILRPGVACRRLYSPRYDGPHRHDAWVETELANALDVGSCDMRFDDRIKDVALAGYLCLI